MSSVDESDTPLAGEMVWNFSRDGKLLEIRRGRGDDHCLLRVHGDGPPRTYQFPELSRLEQFQSDFEKFLIATGWTFLSFSPEQRTGHERRHFSRLLTDRRRWWTDGLRPSVERDADEHDPPLRRRRQRQYR